VGSICTLNLSEVLLANAFIKGRDLKLADYACENACSELYNKPSFVFLHLLACSLHSRKFWFQADFMRM
jgi:hypothetical protein